MSPEARERSFDELATGLASGSLSRGRALRLMGAALVGGLLAFTPKVAEAALPKCKRASGECRKGSCCGRTETTAGTCCGTGVSCIPAAVCSDRVQTICAATDEFGTTCLAGCQALGTCATTTDCPSGMVCAQPLGSSDKVCLSPCKGGRTRSR
jgi:hypothetical protein